MLLPIDPLSISASIIATLQATNSVVSLCYNYHCAVKCSSWDLPNVTEKAQSLRNVLETLEGLARKAESSDPAAESRLPALRLLCKLEVGLLAKCIGGLEALEKKLALPRWIGSDGYRRKALVQVFGLDVGRRRFMKDTYESRKVLRNVHSRPKGRSSVSFYIITFVQSNILYM